MVGFKKKIVSNERVASVENAAANAPIVGDPRIGANLPVAAAPAPHSALVSSNLGSIQDLPLPQGGYQVGMVYDVPVVLVKSNPFNPRAVYTNTAIEDMAQSLKNHGQRISATGFIGDQGEVFLIEGETRLRGTRSGGLQTLRIEIRHRPNSDRELYEEARAANVERRDQTPLDDAIKWKELLSKKVYPTQSSLAKAMNLGEDQVSRTLSLATLPNRIIHACAEHPGLLTLQMLNAIREYFECTDEESTLELIYEAAKTGMGYRDVISRRKAAVKGPIKRPRSTREALSFRGAKGELKTFEEDGRMELVLKGLSAEAANDIAEKIKALFPKE